MNKDIAGINDLDPEIKDIIIMIDKYARMQMGSRNFEDELDEKVKELQATIPEDLKYVGFRFPNLRIRTVGFIDLKLINKSDKMKAPRYKKELNEGFDTTWYVDIPDMTYFCDMDLGVAWADYLKWLYMVKEENKGS